MSALSDLMASGWLASARIIGTQNIISAVATRQCIATGINRNLRQVPAGYEFHAQPSCEMLKTDFADLKVGFRDTVKIQVSGTGEPLETVELVIHSINSDPSDPCVTLYFAIEE
jgi:hypothetical protein